MEFSNVCALHIFPTELSSGCLLCSQLTQGHTFYWLPPITRFLPSLPFSEVPSKLFYWSPCLTIFFWDNPNSDSQTSYLPSQLKQSPTQLLLLVRDYAILWVKKSNLWERNRPTVGVRTKIKTQECVTQKFTSSNTLYSIWTGSFPIICWYVVFVVHSQSHSDSLWPHGLQHTRLPYPSLSPRVCSNSCPLSWWCYLIISSSVIPFSFCLQSFPVSGSFPMSWFFASGGQSIGASASASVLPVNIQGIFSLELTGLISLQSKGLSRVFSSTIRKYQFLRSAFIVQLSHSYMNWKNQNFDDKDLCGQSDVSAC